MIRKFVMILTLALLTTAVAHADGNLTGDVQLQRDLVADAPSNFAHLVGHHWTIGYQGGDCANLGIEPAANFTVTRLNGANQFDVVLNSTQGLLDEIGEVVSVQFSVLGCSTTVITPTREIGVSFKTTAGVPLDVQQLRYKSGVTDVQITVTPSNVAHKTREDGNQVYFEREAGFGTVQATVTLSFRLNGQLRSYPANLPVRDDGQHWGERIQTGHDYAFTRLENEYASSRDYAYSALLADLQVAAPGVCERKAAEYRSVPNVLRIISVNVTGYHLNESCGRSAYSDYDRRYRCMANAPTVDCEITYAMRALVGN
jgi:hypothetical protein